MTNKTSQNNDEKFLFDARELLLRLGEEDFGSSNENFMELLKLNSTIAVASYTLLGLYFGSNQEGDNLIAICALLLLIFMTLSLVCGVLQFFIDYLHARKWGKLRFELANKIADGSYGNYHEYYKDHNSKSFDLNDESNTFLLYLQLIFMGLGIFISLIFVISLIL